MNMSLLRTNYLSDGVFGIMRSEDGQFQVDTIEHAYFQNGVWLPKIPAGVYTCKRRNSPHFGYDVFEVTNVPNATYIEIHIANTQNDVHGCIGIGEQLGTLNGMDAVLQSGIAFRDFMSMQRDIDSFQLEVT
jgi:Family of unknown function (DUF5675)